MSNFQRFFRRVAAAIAMAIGLTGAPTSGLPPAESGNLNPGVLPLHSNPYGKTYAEWSARFTQWGFSIPVAINPILDVTGANCAEGQSGPVWFLAGSFSSGTVERSCTVPHGKALFFPIDGALFGAAVFDCEPTAPGVPCDVPTLRAAAAEAVESVTLEASIDHVPLHNLTDYRVPSPVFSVTLPEDNVVAFLSGVDVPGGIYAPVVSDGYFLMLAPLSAGAHTIHFKATVNSGPFTGSASEIIYHLTIGR